MCVLGKDAPGLQGLTVTTCSACFRVKFDCQHQSASAHLAGRVGADAPEAIEKPRALDGGVLNDSFLDKLSLSETSSGW